MKSRQGAALDRKKFFADPVMVVTIVLLTVLLALFILYPLAMLLLDSVYVRETTLVPLESVLSGEAEASYGQDKATGSQTVKVVNNKKTEQAFSLDELSGAYGFLFASNGRMLKEGE